MASVVLSHAKKGKSKAGCDAVVAAIEAEGTPLTDLAFALRAGYNLGCLKKKYVVGEHVVAALQAGLESSSLTDIYAAVTALPVASARGGRVDVAWGSVAGDVLALLQPDGAFKMSRSSRPSALAAGYAYHILASAWDDLKASSDDLSRVRAAVSSIGSLLATADVSGDDDSALSFGEGEDRLWTTSLLVSGALKLATVSGEDVDLQADQVAGFAEFLLQHRHSSSPFVIGQIVIGLRAVASNSVAIPLAVSLDKTSMSAGSNEPVTVSVTDVFGEFATAAEVTADSVSRSGSSRPVMSSVDLTAVSDSETNTQYALDLMSSSPAAGLYSIELYVRPSSEKFAEIESVTRTVAITARMAVRNAKIIVGDSTATAVFPDASPTTLSAGAKDTLHVKFSITAEGSETPVVPHQAFVLLRHTVSAVETMFVASPESGSSSGAHRLTLDISDRAGLHEAAEAGTYEVHLFLGDSTIENGVAWHIGNIDLSPPPAPPKPDEILYSKPLLHESDTTLKALPEIHHQFRQPEPRPSAITSRTATVLVILPIAVLFLGLLRVSGGDFGRFGVNGTTLWAILFFLSLGSLLALTFVYWLRLTMFLYLSYAVVPSIIALLSGRQLLHGLHADEFEKPKRD